MGFRQISFWLALLVLAAACASNDDNSADSSRAGASGAPVAARIAVETPIGRVDERFLSFAVDSSQVVGGHWWAGDGQSAGGVSQELTDPYDFSRPRLRQLAAALAPAFLRIGGSEADKLYYDLSDAPVDEAPEGYEFVLDRATWSGAAEFARAMGFDLMFTLNAGPGPRDADGQWTPDNARALLEYAVARHDPVGVWELGNEINGYQLVFGPGFRVDGEQYAADFATLRALVDEVDRTARLAGPASAFWPVVGEMAAVLPGFLRYGGQLTDIVSWHYYPTESRRCPLAVRKARPDTMLRARYLDEVTRWSTHVGELRDEYAPNAQSWLGETGHAQCGGEPGVSDRYGAGFWWLDELGLMAREGVPVVVRQTLSGSDYGMIDDATLRPNPDYWNSVLWKRLMGPRVLAATVDPGVNVRTYAHCTPGRPGAVTLLALNLNETDAIALRIKPRASEDLELYLLTSSGATSPDVLLNGELLEVTEPDGVLPPLDPLAVAGGRAIELPALSYAFVLLPDAAPAACGEEGQ
jgi:heparanase 1